MFDPDDGDLSAPQFLNRSDEFARFAIRQATADLVEQ